MVSRRTEKALFLFIFSLNSLEARRGSLCILGTSFLCILDPPQRGDPPLDFHDGSADCPHLNESDFSSSRVKITAFIPKFVVRIKVPTHAVLIPMPGIEQALNIFTSNQC